MRSLGSNERQQRHYFDKRFILHIISHTTFKIWYYYVKVRSKNVMVTINNINWCFIIIWTYIRTQVSSSCYWILNRNVVNGGHIKSVFRGASWWLSSGIPWWHSALIIENSLYTKQTLIVWFVAWVVCGSLSPPFSVF